MDEKLTRRQRIRLKKDFQEIYKNGQRSRENSFSLVYRQNDLGYGRLGVVVSRKVGTAVARNRVKRWFREIFRKNKGKLPESIDLIIIAKPEAAAAGRKVLEGEYCRALEKINAR